MLLFWMQQPCMPYYFFFPMEAPAHAQRQLCHPLLVQLSHIQIPSQVRQRPLHFTPMIPQQHLQFQRRFFVKNMEQEHATMIHHQECLQMQQLQNQQCKVRRDVLQLQKPFENTESYLTEMNTQGNQRQLIKRKTEHRQNTMMQTVMCQQLVNEENDFVDEQHTAKRRLPIEIDDNGMSFFEW